MVPALLCVCARARVHNGKHWRVLLCSWRTRCLLQGMNGASRASDNDFDVEDIKAFYLVLQEAGYWTMVTGRDDLTKKSGPPISN